MTQRPFFARYGFSILVLFAVVTPLLLDSAIQAVRSNRNNVQDWLPASFTETGDLVWFRRHFASDQFVIISWDGCQISGQPGTAGAALDDPRIEQLANLLVPDSTSLQPITDASDTQTSDAQTSDAQTSDTQTSDTQTSDTQTSDTQTSDAQTSDAQLSDTPQYFKTVTTARRLLTQMTAGPSKIPFTTAVARLQGSLLGADGRQSCLVVTLSNEAVNHFRQVLGRGTSGRFRMQRPAGDLFSALEACGIPAESVHLGGPPVDNVAIDEEGERTLIRLAGLAGLLGLGLAWWSLRSVKLTLIVYSCGILSAIFGLAAVNIAGESTDAILLSMPALVYVLAISGAIHLVNHYREAIEAGHHREAAGYAIAHGWKPALFCSVTTACGLMSLYGSDLVPISKFGTYSALAVMLMLIVLFAYLPAALEYWKPKLHGVGGNPQSTAKTTRPPAPALASPAAKFIASHASHGTTVGAAPVQLKPPRDLWGSFGGAIIRHHRSVSILCMLIICATAWGITRIRTTIDLLKLFDSQARILQDYRWLESHVGRLVPLEIAIQFQPSVLATKSIDRGAGDTTENSTAPNGGPNELKTLSFLDRLDFIASLQKRVDQHFGRVGLDLVGPSMSAVTFVPPLPTQHRGLTALVRRKTLNSQLEQSIPNLMHSGYLAKDKDGGGEIWRISLRVAAFKDVDYGQFSDELRQLVDPIVAAENQKTRATTPAIAATYTGVVPIVYKAQRALLESLVQSTVWSFLTIAPLLMFVSRGVRSGLVAMLPNILPVVVVFGGMGWLGYAVDIGSMMSASIALGVAVDDTIHYLTWFRDDLKVSGDRNTAILAAYRRCALPTLQASLINGIGLSVFALSTFTPTKQFGFLMLTILIAGVVAELILLPALLAGPLGAVFETPVNRASETPYSRSPQIRSNRRPAISPTDVSRQT